MTESMPKSDPPHKMNGATLPGRSMPPARPQAAMAPPYFVIDNALASVAEPTESMPPAQRSLASGPPDVFARPQRVEIARLSAPAGRGDHGEAELGEQRNRARANAAGRSRHQD